MPEIRNCILSEMASAETRISPENETNKILWDFEVETDQSIPLKNTELVKLIRKQPILHLKEVEKI